MDNVPKDINGLEQLKTNNTEVAKDLNVKLRSSVHDTPGNMTAELAGTWILQHVPQTFQVSSTVSPAPPVRVRLTDIYALRLEDDGDKLLLWNREGRAKAGRER